MWGKGRTNTVNTQHFEWIKDIIGAKTNIFGCTFCNDGGGVAAFGCVADCC